MSELIDVVLPEDQVEGTRSQVQRWLVAVGEAARRDAPLVEIETDKVTVEVPAPADGVLVEIVATEGTDVAPGAVLARLRAGAAQGGTATPAVAPVAGATAGTAQPAAARSAPSAGSPGRLSPAVKRLLAERGLSAESVRGSGEGGRITVDDVLAAAPAAGTRTPQPSAAPADAEPPADGVRRVPHTPMRRRIAAHMVESLLHTAPHVTTVFQADMTAVLAHRAANRAEFERRGHPLTLTAYFVAACVEAFRAVPEALPGRGLVVPVIRDAGRLDLAGIAAALGELVRKARDDALTPTDLRGGTFTISNHGVSGSLVAAPIVINQPQSAILGVGKLEKRAIVASEHGEDRIVVRPCCYVTLTIDHRVLDGHQANHFMDTLVRRLETWR